LNSSLSGSSPFRSLACLSFANNCWVALVSQKDLLTLLCHRRELPSSSVPL